MASSKQISANRRNALKSSGPKSREGKLRSSQNARKHGFSAVFMKGGLEDAVLKKIENYVSESREVLPAVRGMAKQLAESAWLLEKLWRLYEEVAGHIEGIVDGSEEEEKFKAFVTEDVEFYYIGNIRILDALKTLNALERIESREFNRFQRALNEALTWPESIQRQVLSQLEMILSKIR
jgi:hypothetical protein